MEKWISATAPRHHDTDTPHVTPMQTRPVWPYRVYKLGIAVAIVAIIWWLL